ncbi:MAG: hypothetical protein JSS81_29590 [Acidobacteria bacterium]|nr:hypothetical protein [Acidobacteriota bacterium]
MFRKQFRLICESLLLCLFSAVAGASQNTIERPTDDRNKVSAVNFCDSSLKEKTAMLAVEVADGATFNKLKGCPRKKLIEDLSEISRQAPENDPIRFKTAYLLARLGYESDKNKALILSAFSPKDISDGFPADDAAILISSLIEAGDKSLLSPVLDAVTWADGGVSEIMSDIIFAELARDPRALLKTLQTKPLSLRKAIYEFIRMDLAGHYKEKRIIGKLKAIGRKSPYYATAKEFLSGVGR